jgi:putative SOS response-associated peptidase YedK
MCGRYTNLFKWKQLHRLMTLTTPPMELGERYNIAPTQSAPVVRAADVGGVCVDLLRWGLIPSWADDASIGGGLINARSETVAQKPAFRAAYRGRRCVVPASGFYEWQAITAEKRKQPYYIVPAADDDLFLFAGLWERWTTRDGGDAIESFAILTTSANELMATLHERMPVILAPQDASSWLDAASETAKLEALFTPFPSDQMRKYPVSTLANSPRNDSPACIEPSEELGTGLLF